MLRFRTLTQRFGALYAVLTAILVGVTAIATLHLQRITVDSERLIEEAREQTTTAQLITEVDALVALLQQPSEIDASELARARELLLTARLELAELESSEDDPSRPTHQRSEDRIADRLLRNLSRVDALLAASPPAVYEPEVSSLLSDSRHYAAVLLAEARREAREADADLHERADSTQTILVATWITAVLVLGGTLVVLQHGVVTPLRSVRAGAERFGSGEREHRIHVHNTDEIGDLANSFNTMADRLSSAHDDLEARVRRRTREFIRAARLADLGILASGIAHEINTPLASIASSGEGLQRRAKDGPVPPDVLREYTRVIVDEAFRAREITTRMLALVRQEPSDVARVSLGLIVQQAETALRHRASQRGVALAAPTVPADLYANVNAGELVQILVNLLANAVDASAPGGRVEFTLGVTEGELAIVVRDDGSGIGEDDLERVFEPFFTTKAAGSGTGLGLALVATMVEFRGGRVSVESELGQGSSFRITLPSDWSQAV